MIFEVSWGDLEKAKSYTQHIVGAYHFNTDWIENDPVWNLSTPKVIEQNLIKNGIAKTKRLYCIQKINLLLYEYYGR